MVMVAPKLLPQATWEFEAEILVLHHPTTISPRYQAMGEFLPPPASPPPPRPHSLRLRPCSPLRQHPADGHHPEHEQGLPEDGGQGHRPLPLHQDPRVPALRAQAGVPGGPHQSCGHRHQGNGRRGRQLRGGSRDLTRARVCLCPQLLQAVNTQASKAQQAKMASSRRKEGVLSPEEARPPSPNAAQLQVGRRDKALCSSTFLLPHLHPSPAPPSTLCFLLPSVYLSICPLPVPASDRMSRLCGEPGKVPARSRLLRWVRPFQNKSCFYQLA